MKKSIILIALVLLTLLWMTMPILAQTEVSPALSPEQGLLEAALDLLIKAIANITFVPIAALLVVALTGIFKRFLPASVPAGLIVLVLQVITWVLWMLALHFGYGAQFESAVQLFTTIATIVAGLVGSTVIASAVHNLAAENKVPLVGYKRDSGVGSDI